MTVRGGLARASAVQGGGRTIALGLQAVHFAVVARLLAPADLGHYVAALAVFGIAGALAEFGLLQTTVLELHRRQDEERAVLGASARATISLGVGSLTIAAAVTWGALPVAVRFPALVLVPAFVVVRAQLSLVALRQHRLQFRRLAVAEVAGRFVAVVALVPVALGTVRLGPRGDVAAAGLSILIGGLVTLAALAVRPWPEPRHQPEGSAPLTAVTLIRDAVPLGLANASSILHMRIDQVILSAVGVSVGLAAYGVAYRGLEAALGLVTAVGVVVLPHLARVDGPDRAEVAARVERFLLALAVAVGMVAFTLAPVAASVLGGSRYPEAAWYLRLLCPALVISVVNLGYAQIAIVGGRARSLLGISVAAVLANTALNLMLVSRLGVRGSIAATLVTEGAGAIAVAALASRTMPGALRPERASVAVAGFALACFGGLGAWRLMGPVVGSSVMVVGALLAFLPVIRPGGSRSVFRTCDSPAPTPFPV